METNETKNLEYLKKLATEHFQTLKPANDQSQTYTAQIRVLNYFELGCVITDLLKLCILALHHNRHKISENNEKESVDVALVLETVLSLFPLDELEFLSYVREMVDGDLHLKS